MRRPRCATVPLLTDPSAAQVPHMKESGQNDERRVDSRKTLREPRRQVHVRDRAVFSTKRFRHASEGAPASAGSEHQGFTGHNRARDRSTAIGSPAEASDEQVQHGRLDGQPHDGVDGLDSDKRCPPASAPPVSGRDPEVIRHRCSPFSRTRPECPISSHRCRQFMFLERPGGMGLSSIARRGLLADKVVEDEV